jgi:Protein of unknown function (DUF3168)
VSSGSIRNALYQRLTADASLLDLLATPTSVFDEKAPQGAPRPYVVISRPSNVTTARTFGGAAIDNDLWQLKAIDGPRGDGTKPSASTAEDIAQRIDFLLDGHQLDIEGRTGLWLAREGGIRYPEDDGQSTIWHVGSRFRLLSHPA